MEENVCASLLSLVDDDLTDIGMVVDGVAAESHPNACPDSISMSTATMEAALLILLGIMTVSVRMLLLSMMMRPMVVENEE